MDGRKHFYLSYCLLTRTPPKGTWYKPTSSNAIYGSCPTQDQIHSYANIGDDGVKLTIFVTDYEESAYALADHIIDLYRSIPGPCSENDLEVMFGNVMSQGEYIQIYALNDDSPDYGHLDVCICLYPDPVKELALAASVRYREPGRLSWSYQQLSGTEKMCDINIDTMTCNATEYLRGLGAGSPYKGDARKDMELLYNNSRYIPPMCPYTHHGKKIPIEYRRVWWFLHCCYHLLPKCLLWYVSRTVLDVYFLEAELELANM